MAYQANKNKLAGEDLANDVMKSDQRAESVNLTASGSVKATAGRFYGIIVNSHTSGTIKLWDGLSAAGAIIMNTYTFPAGSGTYVLPTAIQFKKGLYATIGGTLDCTILYN